MHAIRVLKRPFLWAAFAVILGSFALSGEISTRDKRDLAFLREGVLKLARGSFGSREVKRAEGILKGRSPELQARAAALLAARERLYEQDYAEAVEIAGEFLVDKKALSAWEDANKDAERDARKVWKDDKALARKEDREPPNEPIDDGIFAAFPPAADWTVNERTALCAVEVIRAHMTLGKYGVAMEQLSTIGQSYPGLAQVLAAECGGDLTRELRQYEKAVSYYEFALKSLDELRFVSESEPKRAYTEDERFVKKRIEQALAWTRRLWDIERYGEGFVLYREGEHRRRREHQYAEAILKYNELADRFSPTVYSEVAEAYTIKCLLALSTDNNADAHKRRLEQLADKVDLAKRQYTIAKRAKMGEWALAFFRKEYESKEEKRDRLEAIPVGKDALESARDRAKRYLKDKGFGLYRGEVLCDLAAYAFEQELDPDAAKDGYDKAWSWLEQVEAVDAQVATFPVPDQAREVSAPPAEEARVDRMGNLLRNAPDVGDIVNRETCSWYLNDLREQAALALGFLALVDKDREGALVWFDKTKELDQLTRMLEEKGEWSNLKRLRWGVEHGYLYAYPDELKLYSRRQRFMILLADFFFCTERFGEAEEIARRLLAGDAGRLSSAETDYPHFLLGSIAYWQGDRKTAYNRYQKVLDRIDRTRTEDRAAFAAAKLAGQLGGKLEKAGLEQLADLAKNTRDETTRTKARLLYGFRLIALGEVKDGRKILKRIPENAGGYYEMAKRYLDALQTIENGERR